MTLFRFHSVVTSTISCMIPRDRKLRMGLEGPFTRGEKRESQPNNWGGDKN
jgi:hypothetical protein